MKLNILAGGVEVDYLLLVISLIGGLALFLYGMQMTSGGLEAVAGNRMKSLLERLTSNRFLGIGVGAGITAAIQSSSATTVMAVGFVNSKMMTLQQAVWIIMGANIGTTITGLLIALDVSLIAPIIAFFGVALVVFTKKPTLHHVGQILAGLGILFIGMDMMSSAMSPLREVEEFKNLMASFSNPVLGILVGALFTAVIQSSAASIGILQGLAKAGTITLGNAVFVLFGQNIGTCITAALASIGASRNAKRTTIVHLLFNLIGTLIFTLAFVIFPQLIGLIESISPENVEGQIAATHIIFNIATTVMLIPFGKQLAKLATLILPEHESEQASDMQLMYIKTKDIVRRDAVGNIAIIHNDIKRELERMLAIVKKNVEVSFDAVLNKNDELLVEVEEREDAIDFLNKEISKYITTCINNNEAGDNLGQITSYFKIVGNLERIGDHAINVCGYTKLLKEKNISFSESAQSEIVKMKETCVVALSTLENFDSVSKAELKNSIFWEQQSDDMTKEYRQNQIARMQEGVCSGEGCIIYSEMLTDFERIGDHILNIAQELVA